MKNIALNTTPLLSPHTGIARYIFNLSTALVSKHVDLNLNYFEGLSWVEALRESHSPSLSSMKDTFVKQVPFSRFFIKKAQKHFFEQGLKARSIDLYHEPNYLPLTYKSKIVITVHDLSFIRFPETHPADRVKLLEKKLPEAIDKAAFIFVDSNFVKSELIDCFGVSPDKLVVHHLAVDDVFHMRSEEAVESSLNAFGLEYKKFILTVGTLEPRKNLGQTISAYRGLPESIQAEYPLVIIGAKGWGDSPMNREIGRLVDKGRIIIPGYVDLPSLANIYSSAKVFLYPSLYEGFGLPPLEAMASGVPVLVSNVSSLPEVVGQAGVLVEVGDVDQMISDITSLILDEERYHSLSASSLARSLEFSWEKCADITAGVYRRAMEL